MVDLAHLRAEVVVVPKAIFLEGVFDSVVEIIPSSVLQGKGRQAVTLLEGDRSVGRGNVRDNVISAELRDRSRDGVEEGCAAPRPRTARGTGERLAEELEEFLGGADVKELAGRDDGDGVFREALQEKLRELFVDVAGNRKLRHLLGRRPVDVENARVNEMASTRDMGFLEERADGG